MEKNVDNPPHNKKIFELVKFLLQKEKNRCIIACGNFSEGGFGVFCNTGSPFLYTRAYAKKGENNEKRK